MSSCSLFKAWKFFVTFELSSKWYAHVGVYPVRPPVPAVGGYEGVGEVHTLGSAVRGLSLGDWVIPSPPSSGTLSSLMLL